MHKTQVITDQIKIISLKSLSVGTGAISTFTAFSYYTHL